MRNAARRVALGSLSLFRRVTGASASALTRPRVHLLYLHRLAPADEAAFRSLLWWLADGHRFIGLSEAVRRVRTGALDAPYVTVSVDDGFRSSLRVAAVLEELGTRGAFFVCPSVVGCDDPSRVGRFFGHGGAAVEAQMGWGDLEGLLDRGHEIGSHTLSHVDLATQSRDRLEAELGGSAEILRRRLGRVDHFAWPYGRFAHFTPRAADAVFEAGYASCVSAERGCHVQAAPDHPHELCLRREHVMAGWPQAHVEYFMARSSLRAGAADNTWPREWSAVSTR